MKTRIMIIQSVFCEATGDHLTAGDIIDFVPEDVCAKWIKAGYAMAAGPRDPVTREAKAAKAPTGERAVSIKGQMVTIEILKNVTCPDTLEELVKGNIITNVHKSVSDKWGDRGYCKEIDTPESGSGTCCLIMDDAIWGDWVRKMKAVIDGDNPT